MYYYNIDDEEITRIMTSGDLLQAFEWSQNVTVDIKCNVQKKLCISG